MPEAVQANILPLDGTDPVKQILAITKELKKFHPDLFAKERWLVLNKIDLLLPDEVDARVKEIVKQLKWKGKVFVISGLAREGTEGLAQAAMNYLEGN